MIKLKKINEAFNLILDTDEGGWMREYIDKIAEENQLDLKRSFEFDEAYKKALDNEEFNENLHKLIKKLFWQ